MFCSLSGGAPSDAVVSAKTGHLYERRLIDQIIKDTGKCPFTGCPISNNDLISVVANKTIAPRQLISANIPSMLKAFQNEWDEAMSEVFTLRQHLDSTRQELAQALYQHDAACRVIARLMVERDEARAMLTNLSESGMMSTPVVLQEQLNENMTDAEPLEKSVRSEDELSAKIVDTLVETFKVLSGGRKGRTFPSLASASTIQTYSVTKSFNPHKSDKSGGITCIKADPQTATLILSGGLDKDCMLSNSSTGKVLSKFTGHKKKVNDVIFHPQFSTSSLVLSASADCSVKVWKAVTLADKPGKSTALWTYTDTSEVNGVMVHPSGLFAISYTAAGSWTFLDIDTEAVLKRATSPFTDPSYFCGSFHPDGLLFAFGDNNATVQLWDCRSQKHESSLAGEHTDSVTCIAFSENGYIFASGGSDGKVKLWDLRKQKCTKSFEFQQEVKQSAISSISFDRSGSFLGIGSTGGALSVRGVKDWVESLSLVTHHVAATTGLAWANDATAIYTCSLDKTIKILSSA